MSATPPRLEIRGPAGQQFAIELTAARITIGRLPELNAVALQPDPQQLVTRQGHCQIESDRDGWWLSDRGSANGTFVRRGTGLVPVVLRQPLKDGAVICILGLLTDEGKPRYWELTFRHPATDQPTDPLRTRQPLLAGRTGRSQSRDVCVEYDWLQGKPYLRDGAIRTEIPNLRPQEDTLIRHMARRNHDAGGVPVLCTYPELVGAIWGEGYLGQGVEDLNHLVWESRRKLRYRGILQNKRTVGYRLRTCRAARQP